MTSTEIIAYWMKALHLSTHSFAQLVGVPESTIRMRIKRSTFTTFDEMCRYAKMLGIKEQVFLFPEVYPQKVRETAKKYANDAHNPAVDKL